MSTRAKTTAPRAEGRLTHVLDVGLQQLKLDATPATEPAPAPVAAAPRRPVPERKQAEPLWRTAAASAPITPFLPKRAPTPAPALACACSNPAPLEEAPAPPAEAAEEEVAPAPDPDPDPAPEAEPEAVALEPDPEPELEAPAPVPVPPRFLAKARPADIAALVTLAPAATGATLDEDLGDDEGVPQSLEQLAATSVSAQVVDLLVAPAEPHKDAAPTPQQKFYAAMQALQPGGERYEALRALQDKLAERERATPPPTATERKVHSDATARLRAKIAVTKASDKTYAAKARVELHKHGSLAAVQVLRNYEDELARKNAAQALSAQAALDQVADATEERAQEVADALTVAVAQQDGSAPASLTIPASVVVEAPQQYAAMRAAVDEHNARVQTAGAAAPLDDAASVVAQLEDPSLRPEAPSQAYLDRLGVRNASHQRVYSLNPDGTLRETDDAEAFAEPPRELSRYWSAVAQAGDTAHERTAAGVRWASALDAGAATMQQSLAQYKTAADNAQAVVAATRKVALDAHEEKYEQLLAKETNAARQYAAAGVMTALAAHRRQQWKMQRDGAQHCIHLVEQILAARTQLDALTANLDRLCVRFQSCLLTKDAASRLPELVAQGDADAAAMTEEMEARARAEEQLRRFDGVDPSTLADDELKEFLQLALDEGAIRGFRAAADRLLEVDKGTVADLFAMQDPDPEEVQQIKAEVLAKHGRWVDSLLTRTREYTNGLRYQQSKDEADGGDPWATVDLKAYAERMDVDPSPETAQLNADLAEILRQDEEAAADAASAGDVRLFAEVAHAQQVRELGSDVALSLPSEAELRELGESYLDPHMLLPDRIVGTTQSGSADYRKELLESLPQLRYYTSMNYAVPTHGMHQNGVDAARGEVGQRMQAQLAAAGEVSSPAAPDQPTVASLRSVLAADFRLLAAEGDAEAASPSERRERPRKLRRRTSAAQEAAGHVPYAQSVALVQRAVGAPGAGEGAAV